MAVQILRDRIHLLFHYWMFNTLSMIVISSGFVWQMINSPTFFESLLKSNPSFIYKFGIFSFAIINFICYINVLSSIIFLLLLPFVYLVKNNKILTPILVVFYSIALLSLIADYQAYRLYHIHLNTTIIKILLDFSISLPSWIEILIITGVCFTVILLQVFIYFIKRFKKFVFSISTYLIIMASTLFGLMFCYWVLYQSLVSKNNLLAYQTSELPFYQKLHARLSFLPNAAKSLEYFSNSHFKQPNYLNQPLNYPSYPLNCTANKPLPNILVLMVDSLRYDVINEKIMPFLFSRKLSFTQFNNHWSGGNATQPGVFSFFYGLPATYWSAANSHKISPLLVDQLNKFQYKTNFIFSSDPENPPFTKNILLNAHDLYSAAKSTSGLKISQRDRLISQHLIESLSETTDTPKFTFAFYDTAHGYCDNNNVKDIFKPSLKYCNRLSNSLNLDNPKLYNRYLNAVHYIDEQLEHVFKALDNNHLWENTIVIVTADHGEEFNDVGLGHWGHSSNFSKYQVKVPLWIHWPGKLASNYEHLTTHYDIVPTLLKSVLKCQNPTSEYSVGLHLYNTRNNHYPFFVSSYTNMAIIDLNQTIVMTAGGQVKVYDTNYTWKPNQDPHSKSIKIAMKQLTRFYDIVK